MAVVHAGEFFPDLEFETYSGLKTSVSQAVQGKKHTAFWIMRFIGCRMCQYDIDLLAESYGRFTDKDAQVFVVLQSSRESISGLKGDYQVPFEIVCDTDHTFYKALEVRAAATKEDRMPTTEEDKVRYKAKKAATEARHYEHQTGEGEAQQLPALFVMGPDRKLTYAHYAVNSVDIPDFDEMLTIVDG